MFFAHYERTMRNVKPVHDAGICLRRPVDLPLLVALPKKAEKPKPATVPEPTMWARPAHPKALIEQVAFWHGVAPADIVGLSHKRTLVAARDDAIAAIFNNCRIAGMRYSLHALGRVIGRDHTSCINSLRKRGVEISRMPALDRRYEAGK